MLAPCLLVSVAPGLQLLLQQLLHPHLLQQPLHRLRPHLHQPLRHRLRQLQPQMPAVRAACRALSFPLSFVG